MEDQEKLYGSNFLKKKLKADGYSYNGGLFTELERNGTIPRPKHIVIMQEENTGRGAAEIRAYTAQELEEVATAYKDYFDQKKIERESNSSNGEAVA